ncbi:MAG TPA: hypothetical protein VNF50_10225 [Acidimicrobiales bacterium]|nr:hypothetical protein [Acidimicrobiales bacterium]
MTSGFSAFASATSRLERGAGLRDPGRWLLAAGPALLALGVALIVLGWAGAAYTTDYFSQVPYLISGGILGLALVICGGLCYMIHFILLAQRHSQDANTQVLGALDRLDQSLDRAATLLASSGAVRTGKASSPDLVMTASGEMIHRLDCPVVTGRSSSGLRPVTRIGPAASLCRICHPTVPSAGRK